MKKIVFTIVAFLIVSQSGFAQTTTPRVRERQVNQQRRIHEGVKSGELTRREATKLQAQQAKIRHDKKLAKSDGVVTASERAKLQREQNRASRKIYRQKHDGQKKN